MRRWIVLLISAVLTVSNISAVSAEEIIDPPEEYPAAEGQNESPGEQEYSEKPEEIIPEEDNADETESAENDKEPEESLTIQDELDNSGEDLTENPAAEDDQNAETDEDDAQEEAYELSYRIHVQSLGWLEYVNEENVTGQPGSNLRVEAVEVILNDELKESGDIKVQAYVQDYGWMKAAGSGAAAGTEGESKRLEALRIHLSGELENQYDIYYRMYSAQYGWLGWAKNGEISGTVGYGYLIEALEIDLLEKGGSKTSSLPSYYSKETVYDTVQISTHIQSYGWLDAVSLRETAGTTGQSKRMEALTITLPPSLLEDGNIRIQPHVQSYGWMLASESGEISGTTGESKRMEAVRIYLTDELAEKYDIWYRAHSAMVGWLGWAKNGEVAGTMGYSYRLEAIQIDIQPKNSGTYEQTASYKSVNPVYSSFTVQAHQQSYGWLTPVGNDQVAGVTGQEKRLEALRITLPLEMQEIGNISAQGHVQKKGWLSPVNSGGLVGTTGSSLRLEAIRISLTGKLAEKFDIYYRTCVSEEGWLGWAKNGAKAGSTGWSKAIEAVQICIAEKDTDPYETNDAYLSPPVQQIPVYYTQRDSRWASLRFGEWTVYNSGCVPTSLAMIFSGLDGRSILPSAVAEWLYNNTEEYNTEEGIGASDLCTLYAAEHWGFYCEGLGSVKELQDALSHGRLVIAYQGPGIFAKPGASHAIVLFKYSSGKTYVYDPWDSGRNGWYSVSTIWNQRSTDPDNSKAGYTYYAIY